MFSWFEKRIDVFEDNKLQAAPRGLFKFCYHYSQGLRRWLLAMAVLTAAIALIEVSLFSTLGNIVNWVADSDRNSFFIQHAKQLIWLGAEVLIILPFIVLLQNCVIQQTLLENFPMRIKWNIHRYLLAQSIAYFQKQSSGKIAAKITQTALAVRETVMKLFDVFNYILIYFSGTLFLAAKADWRIMLAFLGWAACYIGMLYYFIPRLRKSSQHQADNSSIMTGRIVDAYTNIMTVKLFSHDKGEESYAKEAMQQYQAGAQIQRRLISQFSIGIYFLNCLLLFAVAAIGLLLWQKSLIAIGAVATGTALALRLNGMAQWIMWEMSALFENIGIVQDGINMIAVDCSVKDAEGAKSLQVKKGNIEFRNVSFGYGRRKIFNNFNLTIQAGQKVGIVGKSGSGKSSLMNMLLRFYDVETGGIYIDGQNIASVDQSSLRKNIGVVSQDTSLFDRSLRDNIAYGKGGVSDEEILEITKHAQAYDFISRLYDENGKTGLDVCLGERGSKLSGGQRQRIAISRVMLKNAPILILDEATSALDSESEFVIQQNLEKLMQGKTVLAIAHRLSTIKQMDRLLVMDNGGIVEDGTHEELLKKGGIYASLWCKQLGSSTLAEVA